MEYVCMVGLSLPAFDDDGFMIDNKYETVEPGEVWKTSDSNWRLIAGAGSVRLEQQHKWIEIQPETLAAHFREKEADDADAE